MAKQAVLKHYVMCYDVSMKASEKINWLTVLLALSYRLAYLRGRNRI